MTDKSTLEQIADQLIGCCFMPPDHRYDIPDDLEREAARQTAQEILAIAIKSPEAAEYWSDKHCQAVGTWLMLNTDLSVEKICDAEQAIRGAQKELNEAEQHFIEKHCKAVRTRLSALKMQQIWEKPECIVEAAEQAIRESK